MFNPLDIIGERFGKLIVTGYTGKVDRDHGYECRCDCGTIKNTKRGLLRSGHTTSCGCYHKSICWKNRVKHGETIRDSNGSFVSPEYEAWASMKERCSNQKHPAYHNYGGRGISVCQEWADSFEVFLSDVGRRPTSSHSLGRINNDQGYRPGNVTWETRAQQGSNRRTNRFLELNGRILTCSQWAEEKGISKGVINSRLKSGWSVERTLNTPARPVTKHGNAGALFSNEDCSEIRALVSSGLSRSEVARRFSVTTTTISRVVDRLGAYRC